MIKDLKTDSTPGPDGIPVSFYKDYVDELGYPLKLIWRESLDTGIQTENPILAIITPIHKGGPMNNPGNYRPIALTNHLTKLFEKLLRNTLVPYLERNNLMNESHMAFSQVGRLNNY